MPRLTLKQQRFVDNYTGNVKDAMKAAGYIGTDNSLCVMGSRLLKDVKVQAAIVKKTEKLAKPAIMTTEELLEMWSGWTRDETVKLPDRMKASELLGKSRALFSEKRIIEGGDTPVEVRLGWLK